MNIYKHDHIVYHQMIINTLIFMETTKNKKIKNKITCFN